MEPKLFAARMRVLAQQDTESFHADADRMMCDLLRELGYSEGVEVYESQTRWFA